MRLGFSLLTTALATAGCGGSDIDPGDPGDPGDPVEPGDVTGLASSAGSSRVEPVPGCPGDNGGITLPPGFCASVFADNLGRARHMAVTPSGDVFVVIDPPPGATEPSHVVALRDADHDGAAEITQIVADDGGNGIAWVDGMLYVAPDDRIVRYALSDGDLVPTRGPEVVVSGLPGTGDHHRKTIVPIGGQLYVNIGSASNACQVENRVPHSPGIDPCPELCERAGVWRFSMAYLGQSMTSGHRVATGVRNANALGANARGELWAAPNGRDQLHDNWPELFTLEQDMRLPSEEIFAIREGADHGWPYCYHDPVRDQMMLAPEYGGDGTIVGRCANVATPALSMPAHWAPLGLTFYDGTQFPESFRGGAFIANHGSRFDVNGVGDPGYNVVFVPFTGDAPSGSWETFATGFTGGGLPLPDAARHRPVGLAVMPDGALLISDDKGGRIWKVTYQQ
ncbi:MAG: PQQ-dependent sugar dehydrogenase [Deltaproteobacteria bacterium]|nr:PQQ-dependent sugar dehydrogenase [Deltaproteobacteria bacterium]